MKQFMRDPRLITLRLDEKDLEILDKAAAASGRGNRSNVLRQLITLVNTPAGHRALGIVDPEPANEWQKEIG